MIKKMRRIPHNTREMFDWGMISYKTFKKIEHMSFEDGKQYCENLGLYQTWSHSSDHIIAYIRENKIDVHVPHKEFVKTILIASDGMVNPAVVMAVWLHFN
ncbi:hypothetical protein Acj9p127 [Acinetobacter phage Acj9]|uniref:Uncharacterized protein n=1 Tax=Acinetobacter phage Acj9 TaxID=760939 RepID=E5EPR1_9CAUD|nr:hypothetical protein Acj9p127 [Acinetobacter phage Acj9]ADG60027.1 hypothetical protein Acj9p127 [Acinetobacter phage Acj9]